MAKVNYETVIVLSTKQGEEGIKALVEKFQTLIAQNGTVDSVDEWGKRRLAYEIDHENEGYYVLINFSCEPEFPAELDRVYKITSGILRTLIIKKEQ
ncbi:30S ribosomal protein S6 [Acetanaerobacterium sp. MSJ-12]|uniref:Small ribosomal subunit protein bS6 n=1 Tax=Bittarella massiliensis (ex Durand et al. 2017) TaxID=1720313 RepID=A0AAQ1RW94_9FIRM|nr:MULTISPECIES: 30S ribosomal protein S6 [Eubacteriales]MCB5941941.1 30S ribosomal protein S6 [bacterium 210820-DFI.6.52]ERI95983.1 ribosomal protein S6 [Clostridium sp. ATCC 29733]MBC2870107.1 30S ribosomal protein S6 [Bittarella massiliensis (ex Durand et al. 2017)]MBU5419705.1 30S ribosomal protein S6 [Acetanaerobacterium sp. MSJ-12]MCQ4950317.1 30S ribosomal protein S6 [Bittarella massiliensis (ex Durand et al. 2017)]